MEKRTYKLCLDVTLFIMVLFLMPYLRLGELLHEILGILFFFIILFHHYLNLNWIKAIPKGHYSTKRLLLSIVNISMAIAVILVIFSGVMISHRLFNFNWHIASMRALHLVASHWLFLLMGLHIGFHLKLKYIYWLSPFGIYGIYVLTKSDFITCLLYKTHFIFQDKPLAFAVLDYFSIMILFASIGALIAKLITKKQLSVSPY